MIIDSETCEVGVSHELILSIADKMYADAMATVIIANTQGEANRTLSVLFMMLISVENMCKDFDLRLAMRSWDEVYDKHKEAVAMAESQGETKQ